MQLNCRARAVYEMFRALLWHPLAFTHIMYHMSRLASTRHISGAVCAAASCTWRLPTRGRAAAWRRHVVMVCRKRSGAMLLNKICDIWSVIEYRLPPALPQQTPAGPSPLCIITGGMCVSHWIVSCVGRADGSRCALLIKWVINNYINNVNDKVNLTWFSVRVAAVYT